jgi:hypothetical protein
MFKFYLEKVKQTNSLLDLIGLLNPTTLSSFSAADSINIVKALARNGLTVSKEMAHNLGASIPISADLSDVLAIASSIPLEIFLRASSANMLSNLASMDTANMDDFRKSFIANKVCI